METLLNDLFHAQPDALLVIAGLAFLGIAIVGSVKTYFDPGKWGRIGAGGAGAILLVAGLAMYKPAPAAPTASPDEAVAQTAATGQAVAAGQTTTFCYIPGKWPVEVGKAMTPGDSCNGPAGKSGKAVLVNNVCSYTDGPLKGTTGQFPHQMYVGFTCKSPDKQSSGTVMIASR